MTICIKLSQKPLSDCNLNFLFNPSCIEEYTQAFERVQSEVTPREKTEHALELSEKWLLKTKFQTWVFPI